MEFCRKAEGLGYSTVSMSDHLDEQFAPLIALTAAAGATSTLRLLTLVLANDYRNPAILAKEATTVDQISGGRLELGIGAGWMIADYEQGGITCHRPGVRIARLAESISILKAAFAGDTVRFSGEHYAIDGLVSMPRPARDTGIPLMVAGGGRKVLSLAARQADIVGVNVALSAGVIDTRVGPTATRTATDEKIAWIREAAGERLEHIELQTRVHLATVTNDRDTIAHAAGSAFGLDAQAALESPHMLIGTTQECIETLHRWRDQWGISYIGFSADAIDHMAPVVAALG